MPFTGIVNLFLERGMTVKDATRKAREVEERARYLSKVLGADITVEDVLECEC
jgi:hypothetical protein